MRLKIALILVMTLPLIGYSPAQAIDYATINGTIVDNSGLPNRLIYLVSSVSNSTLNQVKTENTNFSLQVPKDVKIKLNFLYYAKYENNQYLIETGWQIEKSFAKDENMNFVIPKLVTINGKVQNYSGNPFGYRAHVYYGSSQPFDHDSADINENGQPWEGYGLRSEANVGRDGSFTLHTFSTSRSSFINRFKVFAMSQETSNPIWMNTATYKTVSNDQIIFCLRAENESSMNSPSGCFKDQATEALENEILKQKEAANQANLDALTNQKKLDEFNQVKSDFTKLLERISNLKLKYPGSLSALNAIESKLNKLPITLGKDLTTAKYNIASVNSSLDSSEGIWSKTQLKTITCTKGKSSKKFTGISPKCPSGYKSSKG